MYFAKFGLKRACVRWGSGELHAGDIHGQGLLEDQEALPTGRVHPCVSHPELRLPDVHPVRLPAVTSVCLRFAMSEVPCVLVQLRFACTVRSWVPHCTAMGASKQCM